MLRTLKKLNSFFKNYNNLKITFSSLLTKHIFSVLTVENADYSSAGYYSCIANNDVDMQFKKRTLVVVRCKFSQKKIQI